METTTTHTAVDRLRALLAIPDDRPGAWETEHVEALEDELRAVLEALADGGDDQGTYCLRCRNRGEAEL